MWEHILHIVTLKFIMLSSKFILKWNFIIYRHIGWSCKIKRWRGGLFPEKSRKLLALFVTSLSLSFYKAIWKKTLNQLTIINVKRKQRKLLSAQGSGVCEIIIILGIFGIWFYSIGRYRIWPYGRVFQSNKHICFSGFMWFGKIF